ncbi:unnamed protein product [Clonostachys byssicola]|uniref:Uncharacterized protein n=1 Tax=Clonostachys byssicola TaxID=160290 RepID=A0A9N9Y826_9HYPO|nr:unnamed protein product [Clonostachys byssicola]
MSNAFCVNGNHTVAHGTREGNSQSSDTAARARNDQPLSGGQITPLDRFVRCNPAAEDWRNFFIRDLVIGGRQTSKISQWDERILGKGPVIRLSRMQSFDTPSLALVDDVHAHVTSATYVSQPGHANSLADFHGRVERGHIRT